MAWNRPTLTDLIAQTEANFVSRLSLTSAPLTRSVVRAFARVLAGATHLLFGALQYLVKQLFPDTSDGDFLARQASLFIGDKIPAGFAQASATVTGANGTLIPALTALVRSDGVTYTTDAGATISGGTATVDVTADDAGAEGTLTAGVTLQLESPITGVSSAVTVVASTVDGSDVETDDAYRERLQEYFLNPPSGGTEADWIRWSKEVSGVTRVWPIANGAGAGTVLVRFARDNDASPIPDAGEVAALQTHLDAVKPLTATPVAQAPINAPLNLTLSITPDNSGTRAAVSAELVDLLQRTATPGTNASPTPTTTTLSQIDIAISSADGVTSFVRTLPVANFTPSAGGLATLGTITWV